MTLKALFTRLGFMPTKKAEKKNAGDAPENKAAKATASKAEKDANGNPVTYG